MPYVAIVTILALLEFFVLGAMVSRARSRFRIPAPASTGNETFERYFRVHMNTLEQLMLFLPALWMFASFVSPPWAAAVGMLFIVGRVVYARAYLRDPRTRTLGFVMSALPTLVMMIGVLAWAIHALVKSTAM